MAARRGRPQNPIEGTGPKARYARRLRAAVDQAELTLPALRESTGYSLGTLSKALAGVDLPTWPVAAAILTACGQDLGGWEDDRAEAAAELPPLRMVAGAGDEPIAFPAPIEASADRRLHERITWVMTAAAATGTQPNLIKLAREIGISPALMNDTIEELGGFAALWNRAQQARESGVSVLQSRRPQRAERDAASRRFGPAPVPVSADTPAEFNAQILRVHIWTGGTSVRTLARTMRMAPSTLQNLLHPKNPDRLPDYDKLMDFLRYSKMDPAALSEWIFTWRRLKYAQVAARRADTRATTTTLEHAAHTETPTTPAPHATAA